MLDFRLLSSKPNIHGLGFAYPVVECDFIATNTLVIFTGGSLASGTQVAISTIEKNHPGVVISKCHATNPNSGFYNFTAGTLSIVGGEFYRIVFKPKLFLNTKYYLGMRDNVLIDTNYGLYLEVSNGTLTGKLYSATTLIATTPTSYPLTLDTWYRGELYIREDLGYAIFQLFAENGNLLWADIIESPFISSISNASLFGMGAMAFVTISPGAVDLLAIDYAGLSYTKELIR